MNTWNAVITSLFGGVEFKYPTDKKGATQLTDGTESVPQREATDTTWEAYAEVLRATEVSNLSPTPMRIQSGTKCKKCLYLRSEKRGTEQSRNAREYRALCHGYQGPNRSGESIVNSAKRE